MSLVSTCKSQESAVAGSGLLVRMRAWLAAARPGQNATAERQSVVASSDTPEGQSAVLLPFPVHGEALLVKLADLLRARIAKLAPRPNPFLLTMSRAACSRLAIDHASYIEFQPELAAFHVVVAAAPDTTVTLVTSDFDCLVRFVLQYISGRLADSDVVEVAS